MSSFGHGPVKHWSAAGIKTDDIDEFKAAANFEVIDCAKDYKDPAGGRWKTQWNSPDAFEEDDPSYARRVHTEERARLHK
jgi:hypothetical protein